MQTSTNTMNEEISSLFQAYLADTAHLDIGRLRPFYSVPCLFVAESGVAVLADEPSFHQALKQSIAALSSRGFAGTRLDHISIRGLGAHLALLTAKLTRLRTDGSALEQVGGTYLMRQQDGAWRITAAVIHDYAAAGNV